jgi:hypothetical protein
MIFANHDLRLLFIHVPKCGGSYITNVLKTYYGFSQIVLAAVDIRRDDHISAFCGGDADRDIALQSAFSIRERGMVRYLIDNPKHRDIFGIDDAAWRDYRKFAFVRDPYDKLVSAFFFLKNSRMHKVVAMDAAYLADFDTFVRSRDLVTHFSYSHAFISQYEHLIGYDGRLMVDYAADFAKLDEELCNVLRVQGVTDFVHMRPENSREICEGSRIRNASVRSTHLRDCYNQDILDIVNILFEQDFAHFGFARCATMEELLAQYPSSFTLDHRQQGSFPGPSI